MSEPIVNHHVKDRSAIIELTNRAPSRLSATLAKGPQAVKNRGNYEVYPPHMSRSYSFVSDFGTVLSPRWRKIETLPLPLSAMAKPGSSIPVVVTRKDETAKGPALVR